MSGRESNMSWQLSESCSGGHQRIGKTPLFGGRLGPPSVLDGGTELLYKHCNLANKTMQAKAGRGHQRIGKTQLFGGRLGPLPVPEGGTE